MLLHSIVSWDRELNGPVSTLNVGVGFIQRLYSSGGQFDVLGELRERYIYY